MLTINFDPFPDLISDRLVLRRVTANDADGMIALRGNPENMKYLPRPLLKTQQEALEFIGRTDTMIDTNQGINWGITLKGNPQFIGTAGIYRISPENHRAEIGYMLLPEHRCKGIVTETIDMMLNYGFNQLQLHSMQAVIDPANIASERVLQKNGFVKEAHFLEDEYYNGVYYDSVIYSLLKRNYRR
jgi:RimJ/RimL family protein N-acetyltransferase